MSGVIYNRDVIIQRLLQNLMLDTIRSLFMLYLKRWVTPS
jgi:hypothetical protein